MLVSACAQQHQPPAAAAPSISITPPVAQAPLTPREPRAPAQHNSVKLNQRVLALTFDDGPSPELTPRLLDILRQQGVRATFFVIGKNVQAYPEIARRIIAEGHEIANHSYNHPAFTQVGAARVRQEVNSTQDAIERATGRRPALIRPPYGAINDRVRAALLNEHGLDVILWSVDPLDWKRPGADVVTQRLVDGAHPGAILLAHDIHPGTIEAMPSTIAQLKAKGYGFATVSQLLALQQQDEPSPVASSQPGAVQTHAAVR